MAMSAGGGEDDAPMSAINTTPLVDVMLVLLIIFLIAVPVVIKTVKIKMPVVPYKPTVSKAENLVLVVRGGQSGNPCEVYINQTQVRFAKLVETASARYKAETDKLSPAELQNPDNFPEVHIRGDKGTAYKCIGGTIYAVQYSGYLKIGFITSPQAIG